ncbi:MAG: IS21 family transposase, partial [Amylibacter sp.]
MPGSWITKQQAEIYMKSREKNQKQTTAAAKAGISERSGRSIESGLRSDPRAKDHNWRTRTDPLEPAWQTQLVPLLKQHPNLQAITLLEHLQSSHLEQYPDSVLRTLQRRVKQWRALQGSDKEVMFRQEHIAGQQGLSDFTQLKRVTITLAGVVFKHLLYHFRLAFSHWSYLKVIEGGESFTALAEGLQEALQRLGGSPYEHRTDSLSAAFKNLNADAKEDINARYDALCKQYSMLATRNNRGLGHENGSVESPHGHLKRRIEQALLLRGSYDFVNVAQYQLFIDAVVMEHNRRNAKAISQERSALQALPEHRAVDYTQLTATVSSSSTIDVRRVTYTVPSRLQGEALQVRLYDNRLLCYLGHVFVIELKRLRPEGNSRGRVVNYQHVIHSLVKKPQAFRHCVLRDDLLPNNEYRAIWQTLDAQLTPKEACKLM